MCVFLCVTYGGGCVYLCVEVRGQPQVSHSGVPQEPPALSLRHCLSLSFRVCTTTASFLHGCRGFNLVSSQGSPPLTGPGGGATSGRTDKRISDRIPPHHRWCYLLAQINYLPVRSSRCVGRWRLFTCVNKIQPPSISAPKVPQASVLR